MAFTLLAFGSIGVWSQQSAQAEVGAVQRLKPEPVKALTVDDLRRFLKVDVEIASILSARVSRREGQGIASEGQITLGMAPTTAELEVVAAELEAEPVIRRVLSDQEWTALEYLRTYYAAVGAILYLELPGSRQEADLRQPSARLLANLPADLNVLFEEWKRLRLGPTLEWFRQQGGEPGSRSEPVRGVF